MSEPPEISEQDRQALSLLGCGICGVPPAVAVCPECGGSLYVEAGGWGTHTGRPVRDFLDLTCIQEDQDCMNWSMSKIDSRAFRDVTHQHDRLFWLPTCYAVADWCGAIESPQEPGASHE